MDYMNRLEGVFLKLNSRSTIYMYACFHTIHTVHTPDSYNVKRAFEPLDTITHRGGLRWFQKYVRMQNNTS